MGLAREYYLPLATQSNPNHRNLAVIEPSTSKQILALQWLAWPVKYFRDIAIHVYCTFFLYDSSSLEVG